MSERAAFESALRDDPDDDDVRIVFADWLDENHDPDRAEFIRAQVRLARMQPWDAGYTALDVRARALERRHPEWLAGWEQFVSRIAVFFGWEPQPFHRGFLARMEMTTANLVHERKRLRSTVPLHELTLDLSGNRPVGWANNTEFSPLRDLTLHSHQAGQPTADLLALLDRTTNLRALRFSGAAARTLFAHPVMGRLVELQLSSTPLTDAAEERLRRLPLPNLRRFIRHGSRGLDWLDAPWLPQLEHLTVSNVYTRRSLSLAGALQPMTPALTGAFTERLSDLTHLRELDLGGWSLDRAGAMAFGTLLARSQLESLALTIPNPDEQLLTEVVRPLTLRSLFVRQAKLRNEFVTGSSAASLRVLALDTVGPISLRRLAAQIEFPALESLRLGIAYDHPSDADFESLSEFLERNYPRLTSLTLCSRHSFATRSNTETDSLARSLATCPGIAGLRELRLDFGEFTTGAARVLSDSPYLTNLELFDLEVASPEAGAVLRERFGAAVQTVWGARMY